MRTHFKKQRKDGGGSEHRVTEIIRVKEILGEALDLILDSHPSQLKKILNSASWDIKKAILVEALELGNIERANALATHILDLTEVKEKKITGDVGMHIDQNIQVLMAEITDLPYEVIEERATKLKKLREVRRLRTSSPRGRDAEEESGEVLLVEDGTVSEET